MDSLDASATLRWNGFRGRIEGASTALSVATAVDRRDFGIEFNADLPSGGQVLEWEVTINVDLELVAQEA